jgi:branched-chain amino acid transport system permease protein
VRARGLFILVIAAAAAAGFGMPHLLPGYLVNILTEALIFGLFAMSLDLMIGYTRLESFGHAAAYGLGAYASALLLLSFDIPMLIVIPMAAIITGVVAMPIAWVCTRSTGISFAMLTLAFAQLFYASVYQFKDFSGGSDGIAGIARRAGPFGIDFFQTKIGYFYLVLIILILSFLFCRSLVASPFGQVLAGIRENEVKTRTLGYNTRAYRMVIVVLAYAFGGLAGALYAPLAGFASPELFFWRMSGMVLIMVIIGGRGTLVGPILGGAVFLFLEHELSALPLVRELWPLIFGSIFIAVILFAPQGLWGLFLSWRDKRRADVTSKSQTDAPHATS